MEAGFSPEIGHRTITAADLLLFGAATGDYARLHFDHALAAAEPGSPAPIVHGLLFASWALGALAWSAPDRLALGDPDVSITGFEVRLERSMRVGDRFSLRHRPAASAAVEDLSAEAARDTEFEVINQRGERTARGTVSVRDRMFTPIPAPFAPSASRPSFAPSAGSGPLFAGDLIERGPRGESIGRTVAEADVVGCTNLTAERAPLYLNAEFAARGRFGQPIAPPMWTFCLAFGDFLRDLLAIPLPSTGLAGHLGDSFRCFAPVRIGDTIRTRHRPLRCTPSRGRPDMSVVHFGIQVLNQRDELVQDGEIAMWIPSGAARR
ncbi:MaoC family dehydratase N-terminal domain-containing protein [Myxococcota bacterium]|nr:MaoC family dehydratase N-terminal domain-containing protein [Myxococcota bacterium]